MEIDTAPRPPAPTPWGRLALLVVLLGPVTLLVLLPIGLGLDRYVVTGGSMDGDRDGGISRGSLAFERVVPLSDLRVGDVITYPRPGAAEGDAMVTHRIVSTGPGGVVTQGDAMSAPDPWRLTSGHATVSRVEFVVPWVGWAYLHVLHPGGWALFVVSAAALVALAAHRLRGRLPVLRHAVTQTTAEPVGPRSDPVVERGRG